MVKSYERYDGKKDSPKHLRGIGYRTLEKPRGLRGSTPCGPASKGRSLSDEEKKQIELEMKAKGLL